VCITNRDMNPCCVGAIHCCKTPLGPFLASIFHWPLVVHGWMVGFKSTRFPTQLFSAGAIMQPAPSPP